MDSIENHNKKIVKKMGPEIENNIKEDIKSLFENKFNDNCNRKLDFDKDNTISEKIRNINIDQNVLDQYKGYIKEDDYRENVSIGNYIIIKELGHGSSAKVVLAFDKKTEKKVAIKIVKRNGNNCEEENKKNSHKDDKKSEGFNDLRIFREVVISSLIENPFIVKLLDFLYSDVYFFLVFEYVKGQQLYEVILKKNKIPEDRARKYFRQLISAVDYLHKNCIVHRDLKIENIVIDQNDNVKLIDFGLSNFFDNSALLQTFCGSLYFAAPELLMGLEYSGPEVDIWSLGVILYVMVCGKVPFDDESVRDLQNKIKEAKLIYSTNLSSEVKDLITNMIEPRIDRRYSISQINRSKWINIGYTSQVENFLSKRFPLMRLNKEYAKAISTALSFQFPNSNDQLESFYKCCERNNGRFDSVYWLRNPVISMYYLLAENIGSYSNINAKTLRFQVINRNDENGITVGNLKDECFDYYEALHRFVKFVFANDMKNVPSKYFLKSVFKDSEDIYNEMSNTQTINLNPPIKSSYFKGLLQGIKVKHIGSQNALKKIILDIFEKNSVAYEAEEKGYFCSFNHNDEECYFKVSLYYNVIFSEYYLILKCLNSKKVPFKIVYDCIKSSLKYRS